MFIVHSIQQIGDPTSKLIRGDIVRVCSSKKELHAFLLVKKEYYLPDIQFTNMDWLQAVW